MGRLVFLLLIGWACWWAYDTGIVDGLGNGFTPRVGKTCLMRGPASGVFYLCTSADALGFVIDAAETKSVDRLEDAAKVANALKSGDAVEAESNVQVRVADNGKAQAGRLKFDAVEVEVLDGTLAGTRGWVRREYVIDTPLQDLYSQFR